MLNIHSLLIFISISLLFLLFLSSFIAFYYLVISINLSPFLIIPSFYGYVLPIFSFSLFLFFVQLVFLFLSLPYLVLNLSASLFSLHSSLFKFCRYLSYISLAFLFRFYWSFSSIHSSLLTFCKPFSSLSNSLPIPLSIFVVCWYFSSLSLLYSGYVGLSNISILLYSQFVGLSLLSLSFSHSFFSFFLVLSFYICIL
jgi:hypothetical protein